MALARAIVIQPRVLLFDEPLSNLDAKLRVQMRTEIRELQRRLAITTVYVTHDQEEAMAVSDRIAVMNQGRVVQEGTAQDLYHRPASEFVATFVGRVNLLPGRVVAMSGGGAGVDVLGTTVAVRAVPAGTAVGGAVRVVVRPEAVEVVRTARRRSPRPSPRTHSWARRSSTSFAAADTTLNAVRYNAGPGVVIPDGAAVGVRLAEEALALLPGAAS